MPIRHSGPPFVTPAKAGVQRGGEGENVARAEFTVPIRHSGPPFALRRRPESRGACPPLGSGWGITESTVPIRHSGPPFVTPAKAGVQGRKGGM